MEIPLGVSVGAVRCPQFGTDFMTLYQNADKALYEIKHNGKRGCAFFHEGMMQDEEEDDKHDILYGLRERHHKKGGFELSLSNDRASEEEFERTMGDLVNVTCSALRDSDIVARHGRNHVMILLFDIQKSDSDMVVDRLMDQWEKMKHNDYKLDSRSESR